jgi:hypothetical protein
MTRVALSSFFTDEELPLVTSECGARMDGDSKIAGLQIDHLSFE